MTGEPTETTTAPGCFALTSRILHWLMAPMVIAQLLVGLFLLTAPFGIEGAAMAVFVGFGVQALFLWSLSRRISARTTT